MPRATSMRDSRRRRCSRLSPVWAAIFTLLWILLAGGTQADGVAVSEWGGPPVTIADIVIRVDSPLSDDFDWRGWAIALMRLTPGDLLTPEQLQQSCEALAPLARVSAHVDPRPGGAVVTVTLQPYPRIESISISGAYPLFEKEVRTAMTVASGDVFHPDEMPSQEALVVERYRNEGYIDPRVCIRWEQAGDEGHYRLGVAIDKGPHYVLGDVRPHGNRVFEDTDIISRLKTWRIGTFGLGFGRFVARDIEADIDNLIAFYRRQGHADATISPELTYKPREQRVDCDLTIVEGPRYRVRFEGNRFYSDFRLRRDLVLTEKGNLGNMGIRRSIQNIRRHYLGAGFADVRLNWEADDRSEAGLAVREVVIRIDEGRRHIVNTVILQGNRRLSSDLLYEHILTRAPGTLSAGPYVAQVLSEDLVAIRALYRNRGFLEAQVTEEVQIEKTRGGETNGGETTSGETTAAVRVIVHIDEGPQKLVANVSIVGDAPLSSETLQEAAGLKSGDVYVPEQVKNDENELAARISEAGYPHVKVTGVPHLSEDRTRVDIRYRVEAGPFVRLGRLFFFGNFRTRLAFLTRESGLATGNPFDLRQVLEAQRRLRDLNIFDSVQVQPVGLKERDETVHLLVTTSERRPYYFEMGGGFQTDKGIFGRAKVGDHNFLGSGKDLALSAEASEVGSRYEASLTEPRLFGTRISAGAGVYVERSEPFNQSFGVDTTGATLNLSRDWGPHLKTVLANQFERREQYRRDDEAPDENEDPQDYDPRRIFVTTPTVQWDSRDSFIRPRHGLLASLAVDFSVGIEDSLDDFVKYRLDARGFYPVLARVTLAGRVYAGYLEPYGGDQPPEDQLFFLGGAATVRGYKENMLRYDADGDPVGGQLALTAGLEARIDIGRNFELIPFLDTGSIQQTLVSAGSDQFRWSYGLGLQYITPIGPVGLFYGRKIDPRPGESSGRFHLSIGYTF